jgi:hypothetical protein
VTGALVVVANLWSLCGWNARGSVRDGIKRWFLRGKACWGRSRRRRRSNAQPGAKSKPCILVGPGTLGSHLIRGMTRVDICMNQCPKHWPEVIGVIIAHITEGR